MVYLIKTIISVLSVNAGGTFFERKIFMTTCKYNEIIAEKLGINAAIISAYLWQKIKIQGFEYQKKKWYRCSYKTVWAMFPFMKQGTPSYAIKKLVKDGILSRTEHNESRFDRTFSYSFTEYGKALMEGRVNSYA